MESIAPAAPPVSMAEARPAALPWHVSAMLAGSTSIVVGILWDIVGAAVRESGLAPGEVPDARRRFRGQKIPFVEPVHLRVRDGGR